MNIITVVSGSDVAVAHRVAVLGAQGSSEPHVARGAAQDVEQLVAHHVGVRDGHGRVQVQDGARDQRDRVGVDARVGDPHALVVRARGVVGRVEYDLPPYGSHAVEVHLGQGVLVAVQAVDEGDPEVLSGRVDRVQDAQRGLVRLSGARHCDGGRDLQGVDAGDGGNGR